MAVAKYRKNLDVRQYCDVVYKELSEMKTKAFDLVCKLETTTNEEEKRKDEYLELFELVDYIEKKLESLTSECPSDWKITQEEIESGKKKLSDAVDWWFD